MDWKNKGGFDNGGGPWGRPPRQQGGGQQRPPEGRKPPPQDFEDLFGKMQERLKPFFRGNDGMNGRGGFTLALVALLLWLSSGIYKVDPDEQGVVLRFGKFDRITEPGLRYHLPAPIETLLKPQVTRLNKVEIGFRSIAGELESTQRTLPEESLMLTGDENIVDINFVVHWKIRDAQKFLFNLRQPEITVKNAAESAMREIVGQMPISTALGEGRLNIEQTTRVLLQSILDSYDGGMEVVRVQMLKADPPSAVIDAFRDVQTARADAERLINQAEAYSNDILPRARGAAEQKILDAQAYQQRVVAQAEGEAARFTSIYDEYKNAEGVTRERLYLETMETVMKGMSKIVVDDKLKGIMPMFPASEMMKAAAAAKEMKNEQQ